MESVMHEAAGSFSLPRPQHYNFARDCIDQWAERDPDHLAMVWTDDSFQPQTRTFADMRAASCRVANMLADAGVQRGDVVIVLLGRQIAWWEVMVAGTRMGAVMSPGTTQLTNKDLAYRINAAQAVCVVTEPSMVEKIDAVRADCPTLKSCFVVGEHAEVTTGWQHYDALSAVASDQFATVDTAADEAALCFFTSGTTGFPKMCIHNHLYPLGHTVTGKFWLDLKPDDLHWNLSDTGWAKAAWSSLYGPWQMGAAVFVFHTSGFDPKKCLSLFDRFPITTFCGAPTIYRMFVLQDLGSVGFGKLRHCVGAGEPLNPEVIEKWRSATGLTIRDGYGQTETVILCGNRPDFEPRFGSMGKPMPGIDLAVIDDEGNITEVGKEGDIAVRVAEQRPVGLFSEYRNEPQKTAKCFRGDWYLTGDRAYVDADGYFWFMSRADDVILSAGYRIGPFEVESALIEHPAVAESAVVSSPDAERGEVVKAFVVLAPGYSASEELKKALQEHTRKVTAPYKYPRKIEFVAELPKTVSGKIRRIELRQQEWGKSA